MRRPPAAREVVKQVLLRFMDWKSEAQGDCVVQSLTICDCQ